MFLPLVIIFVVLTSAYSAQNYHPDHLSRTWIRLQLSLLFKVKKFWPPAKREKGKAVHTTLLYISLLLLALSLDIESNPGPIQTQVYLEGNSTVFPYGSCEQPVTWSCKGVECDACFLWYHATVYPSQLLTGICIFRKYVGIDISSDLSWDTHINRISKKANNTLGFLRRNIKIHSESLKSSAYKVLVCPQLEYCSTVCCPFTDSNISKLEAVQRRAARWVKHFQCHRNDAVPTLA